MIRMFLNGEAMTGGSIHRNIAESRFLSEVTTQPWFRFYSVRDEFPGLRFVGPGGGSIDGELYDVSEDVLRDSILPGEPPELELGVITLSDGSPAFSMVLRNELLTSGIIRDITHHSGWRTYKAHLGLAEPAVR